MLNKILNTPVDKNKNQLSIEALKKLKFDWYQKYQTIQDGKSQG